MRTRSSYVMLTAGLLALGSAVMPAHAAPSNADDTERTAQSAPAYLHNFQQPQQLCPGGSLVGKVSEAVVDPTVAVAGGAGECTLADMKEANPDTTFYAYMNLGAMTERSADNGAFQRTCADSRGDGRAYAVRPGNDRVALNAMGTATYPNWNASAIADLSAGYANACAATAQELIDAPSLPGRVTDADPVRFDGVFFDDVAMTAGHGQDMDYIGAWGPWRDDNHYARQAAAAIETVNRRLDEHFGRDVPVAINLGIYPEKQHNVDRARELAESGAVAFAFREFTTQDRDGNPLPAEYLERSADVNSELTAAGMRIVNHDYAMPLRSVGAAGYAPGEPVTGAGCLYNGDPATERAAQARRDRDYRMLLGETLLTRDGASDSVSAVIPQVESCRDRLGQDTGLAESVTDATVNLSAPGVRELRSALADGVHGTGERRTDNGVLVRALSDGRHVLVNTTTEHRTVDVAGTSVGVPARSAALAG